MKGVEVIRIIFFSVVGGIVMLWLQPLAYENRIIPVRDYPGGVDTWIDDNYFLSAMIVLIASVIATLLWYFFTARAKVRDASDVARWNIVWWLLGLLPFAAIFISVFVFNSSDDARLSLMGFFIIDGLFLLYWLPTATSSPGSFKYTPPGAMLARRLIGS